MSVSEHSGSKSMVLPKVQYSAVHRFELTDTDLQAGNLSGLAAPEAGPRPCAVALFSGVHVISVAKATRFSDVASEKAIRRGWCGFTIGGMAQGLALSGDLELRCLMSERVLGHWAAAELATVLTLPARRFLSVNGLRERLHVEGGCSDYKQVLPFALDLIQSRGSRAVLEASYRYLQGRSLDASGEASFTDDLSEPGAISACWKTIIASDEFRARRLVGLSGPFDSDFPFPLDGIDH